MYFNRALPLLMVLYGSVNAQRPADQSICDYYTVAVLQNNTAENQKTLLVKLVNTAVIGNYTTTPAPLNAVPGILAADGGLLKYFDGSLMSTNRGGQPTSVNFLDDGGAEPLTMDKPANGENSRQYRLLTHLYQYFGKLLGCTQGDDYQGSNEMFAVHRYMDLSKDEMNYFITQVGLSAASFGVTMDDITAVAMALNNTFNMRCSPRSDPIMKGSELQSMCTNEDCALSMNATCGDYPNNGTGVEPQMASMNGSGSATGTEGSSGGMPTATGAATGGAVQFGVSATLLTLSGLAVIAFM